MTNKLTVEQAVSEVRKAITGNSLWFKDEREITRKMQDLSSYLVSHINVNQDVKSGNTLCGEIDIPLAVVNDLYEKGMLEDICRGFILSDRMAKDFSELLIVGNRGSEDPFLALTNGIMAKSTLVEEIPDSNNIVCFSSPFAVHENYVDSETVISEFFVPSDTILAIEGIDNITLSWTNSMTSVTPHYDSEEPAVKVGLICRFEWDMGNAKVYTKKIEGVEMPA